MNNIEVEVRSFVTKEKYDKLYSFFKKNAKFVKEYYQETYYFDAEADLRIQRNKFFSKIWLKKGRIHDGCREEIEVRCDRRDFDKLEEFFLYLGFNIKIKWFRKRCEFDWNGIKACLDYTKGYGYIIELEKMCSKNNKKRVLQLLKQKLKELNVVLNPRKEFEKNFKYYEKNWEQLINS